MYPSHAMIQRFALASAIRLRMCMRSWFGLEEEVVLRFVVAIGSGKGTFEGPLGLPGHFSSSVLQWIIWPGILWC
ncbi:hypothetical protein WAI453_009994 [Rhynchosporium graminicola]